MAKSPGRIALYELVNKARFKSAQQKALATAGAKQPPEEQATDAAETEVQLEPQTDAKIELQTEVKSEPQTEIKSEPAAEKKPVIEKKPAALWSARPKPVRIYADRIELCFSWQVVGLAVLAFVVLLLVFFKLGRISSTGQSQVKSAPVSVSVEQVMPKTKPAETVVKPSPQPQAAPRVVEPMGDNVIVIASHRMKTDLEPVKEYFAKFGIATEVIKRGTRYLLVTQNRFNDVEKPNTDGYIMKRKIMSIGANYKPPIASGFESFGPKPFQDAYGMKLE